jgi:hypothetical protein
LGRWLGRWLLLYGSRRDTNESQQQPNDGKKDGKRPFLHGDTIGSRASAQQVPTAGFAGNFHLRWRDDWLTTLSI